MLVKDDAFPEIMKTVFLTCSSFPEMHIIIHIKSLLHVNK